jgi:hypothetical protein
MDQSFRRGFAAAAKSRPGPDLIVRSSVNWRAVRGYGLKAKVLRRSIETTTQSGHMWWLSVPQRCVTTTLAAIGCRS